MGFATPEYLNSFMHMALFWDENQISSNLKLNSDYDPRIASCKASLISFKSAYSSAPFLPGDRYYFEIKFLKGCNFKVGVSKTTRNVECAFCDTSDGFGYYSAGQLRNGSKTGGKKYGQPFKGTGNQDTIGCYVDLIDGRIFFSKNGEILGSAFEGEELLNCEFYAACCCLTKDESFELLFP